MKIYEQQLEHLSRASEQWYEEETYFQLQGMFPHHVHAIGPERSRAIIQLGTSRARSYGFTLVSSMRTYVIMMLMFGSHFDTDPILGWASEILTAQHIQDEVLRVDCLYANAIQYGKQVAGLQHEYIAAALRRAQNIKYHMLPDGSQHNIERLLCEVYPEKCAIATSEGKLQLVEHAVACARKYDVEVDRGAATIALIMLLVGCGFATDDQFPWGSRVLLDTRLTSAQKGQALFHEGSETLRMWIS